MKPSRYLIICASILLLCAAVLLIVRAIFGLPAFFVQAYWAVLAVLIFVAALDGFSSRKMSGANIVRKLPHNIFVGREHKVALEIHHNHNFPWQITLYDHYPSTWRAKDLPITLQLMPGRVATVFYSITPIVRGDDEFGAIEQMFFSRLGLWYIIKKQDAKNKVKVLPDFAQIMGAGITNLERWMNLLGAKKAPRKGLGQDFHQLREYRDEDTFRQIDWKATARKQSLVSREYQDERDQHIVFLLDCGRNMRAKDGDLSHFDCALNAMLLLTYTALRHGDSVGVLTFSNETPRFIRPGKGTAQLGHIVQGLYDVVPTTQTSDYAQAADVLLSQQKRRALVIVLTNLSNEGELELLSSLKHISRRHRLLIASLKEEILDTVCKTPVHDFDGALNYAGAVSYLRDMNKLYQKLHTHKVPFMSTHPHEFGGELISQYLKFKRDGLW